MPINSTPAQSSPLKKGGWKGGHIDNVVLDMKTQLRKFKSEWAIEFVQRVQRRNQTLAIANRKSAPKPRFQTGRMTRGWGFSLKQTAIEIWNVAGYSWYQEYGTKYILPAGFIRMTLEESEQIAEIAKQKAGIKD